MNCYLKGLDKIKAFVGVTVSQSCRAHEVFYLTAIGKCNLYDRYLFILNIGVK